LCQSFDIGYNRSVRLNLDYSILVDFSREPAKIYSNLEELKEDGIVSQDFSEDYSLLAPQNFVKGLIAAYKVRHNFSD